MAANRLYTVGNYEFKEIWSRSKGRSFHILGIYVRLFPIILLSIVGFYFIYTNSVSPNWIYLESLIRTFFVGPIVFFGMCGIVIHDKNALPALKSSMAIYVKMFRSVIPIYLLYKLSNWLFIAFVYLLIKLTLISPVVPEINILDYSTLLNMLRLPIFMWTNNLIRILTWPFLSVIMTIIYTRYISSQEHLDSLSLDNSG